jgi:hypothetical protein
MGGGTTEQSGTSTQINQIPEWMSNAGQKNYAFAEQVAMQPLQQYQGQLVPDTSPQTQQSWNTAANSGNVGSGQYNAGTAGYLGALGQKPQNVTAGQLATTNLNPYMNPYTQQVIDKTLPLMQQQNALSQNQQANAANSSNAFGGSRQGVQQGVAQAQGAMNIGQMAAGLNQANFQQAQQGAMGDIGNRLKADQGNQNAALQKIQSDILASTGLGNLGDSMNKANVANFNMQQSAGAGQSMEAQNQINSQISKFNDAFNYPQKQLGTLLSALGMTPHDTSTSGQTTQQTTTPTDWASIIQKGAGAAADLWKMSDKTVKKDIEPTGESVAGVPSYTYRFKGQPPSTPKIMGPMAQDVQKVAPGAVKRIDGKLAVHAPVLAAFTPTPPTPSIPKGGFMPPAHNQGTTAVRAGSRGLRGALANTKLRPKMMGGLA